MSDRQSNQEIITRGKTGRPPLRGGGKVPPKPAPAPKPPKSS